MRILCIRYIPYALFTTLLYTSLVLLNIASPPTWLNRHVQHATQLFHELRANAALPGNTQSARNDLLAWLAHSTGSIERSISRVDLRGMNQVLTSRLYGTPIGGTWTAHITDMNCANFTLPTTVMFTPESQMANVHAPIPPSSNNGYLNSRIDLRRRKRAFDMQIANPATSSTILLYLRENAVFQPRNVDPAVLVSQLHEAVKRNKEAEKEMVSRKLRKAKKKKKGKAKKRT
jgi:hypothetical protein